MNKRKNLKTILINILMKVRDEKLLDKIYEIHGNEYVEPAYEFTKKLLEERIEQSEDGILVKK